MRNIPRPGVTPPEASRSGRPARVESESEAPVRAPKLLVSVRSAAESLVALEGGASFIDIKEPANGSLGRASRAIQVEVVGALRAAAYDGRTLDRDVTLTAALGELVTAGPPASYPLVPGLSLFKLGLSGCGGTGDWTERLDAWRAHLRGDTADLAAVAYADHGAARAPEPRAVLDYAIDRRLPFLLLDTFEKGAGSLTDLFVERELTTLLEDAHRGDIPVALAGSLRLEDIRRVAELGAEVIAVRGAACRQGNRELELDSGRVRELARFLRELEARPATRS